MTLIPELSRQLLSPQRHFDVDAVSVGWLGDEVPRTGDVAPEFRQLVDHLVYAHLTYFHRGSHTCEVCPPDASPYDDTSHDDTVTRDVSERKYPGNGQCWFDFGFRRFVFPAMIGHYVEDHQYRPPPEVEDAAVAYWRSPGSQRCRGGLCGGYLVAKAADGDVAALAHGEGSGWDISQAYDGWGFGVFQRAAWGAHVDVLRWYLDRHEVRPRKATDACTSAISRGVFTKKLCDLLLEAGADLNSYSSGNVPLQKAAARQDRDAAEILLGAGADINAALRSAATGYPAHAIEFLLDFGAELDSVDEAGRSVLWLAARKGLKPNITSLLEAGADPDLADRDGVTPRSFL